MAADPHESRPDLRFEVKLVCQESARPSLQTHLRLLPDGLRPLFPERRVQTVYFDTLGGRALLENLAGISAREKLRFRWYGEAAGRVTGRLERKVRRNSLGWKEVLPLEREVAVQGAPRAEFRRRVAEAAGEPWATRLAGLEPVQWISYRREYWADASGTVRVTIDRELAASSQRERALLDGTGKSLTPRHLVVEVKFAPEAEEIGTRVVQALPLGAGRSSKFVLATSASHGALPSFLPD